MEETDRKKAEKVALAMLNYRKYKGFTREQLAAFLGTSSQAITKWEQGRKIPPLSMLELMRMKFR